jgi:uncharacterized membrane protein
MMLRPRVYLAAATGLIVLLGLPHSIPTSLRGTFAWNAGGLVYLVLALMIMRRCGVDVIRSRAARQDDSGIVILGVILLAIGASFLAIAELIGLAKTAGSEARIWYLALAGSTIFVSWLVTQVMFAFHYAHEHYSPHGSHAIEGGLDFPADRHPDYWDFIYFSTSIGATSQTSDVSIKSKEIRRLVTLHAVVSFFFNTMVLALTINLAASLVQ